VHSVVIIGAGHAGVQLAASLREARYDGDIILVCDEPHTPYQRPPLSKTYLKETATQETLALRGPAHYERQRITLVLGDPVVSVDRRARTIACASGQTFAFGHCVFATGSRARPASFQGADLAGVFTLRNLDHANQLRSALADGKTMVVIGAGFIGLEFAATVSAAGKSVTIVEVAPRVMGRAVSPPTSDFFADAHRAFGARLLTNAAVAGIEGCNGRVRAVRLTNGTQLPAEVVLLGIGVLAEDRLAREAGLLCGDGIVVDSKLRTSDANVSAIGDCCVHPNVWQGGAIRLESVQNATDQARVLAKRLTGDARDYDALPWFWSDQGDLKLQIAGLLRDADTFVVRGHRQQRAFSVFAFAGGKLRAVESINRAGEHMAARRIIGEHLPLSPAEAADSAFDLKARAMRRG
jgi:3-phenylpropionate/trans-cinnamate dioxygenase ferredoxin reductase subunit